MLRRLAGCTLALFFLLACADDPTGPAPAAEPEPRALGLMEITITVGEDGAVGSASMNGASGAPLQASASATPLDTISGGIQMEAIRTGSFTHGERGNGGVRYLYASFRVRNAKSYGTAYSDPRTNLTFLPVETSSTISGTPVSRLERFDGTDADSTVAAKLKPTGAVHTTGDSIVSSEPDVLQVFTEAEVDPSGGFSVPSTVTTTFPYGFVVRRADGTTSTRELPASPAADQYDGVVTFAYKVPLQAAKADDSFRVSITVLAVDDATTRVTQSLEEQGSDAASSAFQARVAALGATPVIMPGSRFVCEQSRITSVRVAGTPASPTGYLVDDSTPAAQRVTSGADDGGAGTLRQVLAGASAGDVVCLDSAVDSVLLTDSIVLSKDVTLRGGAFRAIPPILSGQNATRVLKVDSGVVARLAYLTVAGGLDSTRAAGILNHGTLTLESVTVSGNSTIGPSNGSSLLEARTASNVYGAGLYNTGTLTLRRSTVHGNSVVAGHSNGADGTTSFRHGASGGRGGDAFGGGIYNTGTLMLDRSSIRDNTLNGGNAHGGDADGYGDGGNGGGYSISPGSGGHALGAGIYNAGTLELSDALVIENKGTGGSAGGGDGGCDPDRCGNGGGGGLGGDALGGGVYNVNGSTYQFGNDSHTYDNVISAGAAPKGYAGDLTAFDGTAGTAGTAQYPDYNTP